MAWWETPNYDDPPKQEVKEQGEKTEQSQEITKSQDVKEMDSKQIEDLNKKNFDAAFKDLSSFILERKIFEDENPKAEKKQWDNQEYYTYPKGSARWETKMYSYEDPETWDKINIGFVRWLSGGPNDKTIGDMINITKTLKNWESTYYRLVQDYPRQENKKQEGSSPIKYSVIFWWTNQKLESIDYSPSDSDLIERINSVLKRIEQAKDVDNKSRLDFEKEQQRLKDLEIQKKIEAGKKADEFSQNNADKDLESSLNKMA